jgi:riboflavin kinase/FMN adenylyltransferase
MIADSKAHRATPLVVTFDRHPKTVIPHSKPPLLIYPLKQKLKVLESCGVQNTILIPFDVNFSKLEANCFVKILSYELGNIKSISVGKNFLFGHNRVGNVALLENMGKILGFKVYGLSPVSLDGKTISSTRIREAISKGEIELASQMLGREYSIAGKVIKGDGIGRTLGFPTANIDVSGLVLPPRGVYLARVVIKENIYSAVLNIGERPTLNLPIPQLRFELHILDFDKEVYGEDIETIFIKKLRDEIKFNSLQELKNQIKKDIAAARRMLK